MEENPSKAEKLMTEKLTKHLDKHAPVKTFQVRKNYVPWLSDRLKFLMRERDQALAKANSTRNPNDRLEYKNLRNTVTNLLRKEKRTWKQKKLDISKNDPESLWKNVRTWLGWGNNGPPSKLIENGTIITKPKQLAESMNSFFIKKIDELKSRIPASTKDPCKKLKEVMKDRRCEFSFQPVAPEEVEKIVLSLKNTKSTGIDNINTSVLKLSCSHSYCQPFTFNINVS